MSLQRHCHSDEDLDNRNIFLSYALKIRHSVVWVLSRVRLGSPKAKVGRCDAGPEAATPGPDAIPPPEDFWMSLREFFSGADAGRRH